MTDRLDVPSTEDPEAKLERALMEEFLRAKHHSFADLASLDAAERQHLLEEAAIYAAGRLAEIGCRAHYVEGLHKRD
jgi:hypothetical protein